MHRFTVDDELPASLSGRELRWWLLVEGASGPHVRLHFHIEGDVKLLRSDVGFDRALYLVSRESLEIEHEIAEVVIVAIEIRSDFGVAARSANRYANNNATRVTVVKHVVQFVSGCFSVR